MGNLSLRQYLAVVALAATVVGQGDPNASACQTVSRIVGICESLTPGFTAFTNFNFQAPCLCYASTYWLPNGYDGWIQSCYAGYKTGNPPAYSAFTASNGGPPITTPCHKVGNILSKPEFTGPVTALVPVQSQSRPPITNPDEAACATLNGAALLCNSATPGFSTLRDFKDQASCYCYSRLVWEPKTYDSLWPACIRFLSTASPSVYSQALTNGVPVLTTAPCAAVGDVRDVRLTTSTKAPSTSRTSSLPPSTTTSRTSTPPSPIDVPSPTSILPLPTSTSTSDPIPLPSSADTSPLPSPDICSAPSSDSSSSLSPAPSDDSPSPTSPTPPRSSSSTTGSVSSTTSIVSLPNASPMRISLSSFLSVGALVMSLWHFF